MMMVTVVDDDGNSGDDDGNSGDDDGNSYSG